MASELFLLLFPFAWIAIAMVLLPVIKSYRYSLLVLYLTIGWWIFAVIFDSVVTNNCSHPFCIPMFFFFVLSLVFLIPLNIIMFIFEPRSSDDNAISKQ